MGRIVVYSQLVVRRRELINLTKFDVVFFQLWRVLSAQLVNMDIDINFINRSITMKCFLSRRQHELRGDKILSKSVNI